VPIRWFQARLRALQKQADEPTAGTHPCEPVLARAQILRSVPSDDHSASAAVRDFAIVDCGSGRFALTSIGLFLCAKPDGRVTLSRATVSFTALGGWEQFSLVDQAAPLTTPAAALDPFALSAHAASAGSIASPQQAEPARANSQALLSRALADAGRIQAAIEAATRAVALDPDSLSIQLQLESLLARDYNAASTEATLQQLVSDNPDDAGLAEHYGHFLNRLGRPEEAEAQFRRAISVASDRAGPFVGLGQLLAWIGRSSEALAVIEAAIGV
jgi:tetratricopeptide (TPR) repeat protein